MKKSLLFSLFLLTGLPALAQIERGNVMLGGTLDAFWTRSASNLSTTFASSQWGGSLSPNVSYFVVKGLALSAVTSYGRNWSRQFNPNPLPDGTRADHRSRSQDLALGPAVHYYFRLGDKLAVYAQTSLSWGKSWATSTFPVSDPSGAARLETQRSDARSRAFTAGPGLAYFLNPHVALLGGVTYRHHRYTYEGTTITTVTTSTVSGAYFNLGTQVFLGGK
jgi:hypothetical protein